LVEIRINSSKARGVTVIENRDTVSSMEVRNLSHGNYFNWYNLFTSWQMSKRYNSFTYVCEMTPAILPKVNKEKKKQ